MVYFLSALPHGLSETGAVWHDPNVSDARVPGGSFAPSGFFVLRTPLLARDVLTQLAGCVVAPAALRESGNLEDALAQDRARVIDDLRGLVRATHVREALFVASPSLDEALEVWLNDPASARARGVTEILVRYVARMAFRPTPFGLFSGCSLGTVGEHTDIVLAPLQEYERHTRLDIQYLAGLTEALHQDTAIRTALTYRPNSGIYRSADQLRYVEGRTDAMTRSRTYHLVSIAQSDLVDVSLDRAAHGAHASDIASALLEHDRQIGSAEAFEFVDSLIDNQVLVSDLAPPITGGDPLASIVDVLRTCSAGEAAAQILEDAGRALEDLDRAGLGRSPSNYRKLAASLSALSAEPDLARLFQVDLYKPVRHASLGVEPVHEIQRAAGLLARITSKTEDPALTRFREAFAHRYAQRMVPLVLALDEEAGLGFGKSEDPSTLLDGLTFPPDEPPHVPFGEREDRLLRGMQETLHAGRHEWILSEEDLRALEVESRGPLPAAFAVMATLAAPSVQALAAGEFRILQPSLMGPSGAALFGRFCHKDAALRAAVEQHLCAEEAHLPNAIVAEIVHLPEGRAGNISCRPLLRRYEIPVLGRSGAPAPHQIPVSDLAITLADGRFVLWSERLACEIIPRLTSPHNYAQSSLGIYRFLCALQQHGVLTWSWGPLANAPFLPRATSGRTVLSLARWKLARDELQTLTHNTAGARFRAVQALRAKRNLPRWVAHTDMDNVLPVDLDNFVFVESWLRLIKGMDAVTLQEVLPEDDELVVTGPEGRFVHELVVPFVGKPARARELRIRQRSLARPSGARTFSPGSEWLYAKLYTGTEGADDALVSIVRPLVLAARDAKHIDRWFFIRYADPDWHLRVRFRGTPRNLASNVLPQLHERAAALSTSGRLWRIEIGTYEREIERYGGDEGIELAEAIFEADSDAALSILSLLDDEHGPDTRWRLALRGCHELLNDFGLDLGSRTRLVGDLRATFAAEHRIDKSFERELGKRFRAERASLESLLNATATMDYRLDPAFRILVERSDLIRPVVERLRAHEESGRLSVTLHELVADLIHLHVNRMLRSAQRAHELVFYDWLLRLYESQAARARRSPR